MRLPVGSAAGKGWVLDDVYTQLFTTFSFTAFPAFFTVLDTDERWLLELVTCNIANAVTNPKQMSVFALTGPPDQFTGVSPVATVLGSAPFPANLSAALASSVAQLNFPQPPLLVGDQTLAVNIRRLDGAIYDGGSGACRLQYRRYVQKGSVS